jgi:hypothetical protein
VLVKEMTGERSDIQRRMRKKLYHFMGVNKVCKSKSGSGISDVYGSK